MSKNPNNAKDLFVSLYSNKDNSLKNKIDKFYRYIFINNHGNFYTIKTIEKYSNNNSEISFNKFDSNKNDIERNI